MMVDEGQEGFAIGEERTVEAIIRLSILQFEQNLNSILSYKISLDNDSKQEINRIITRYKEMLDYCLRYHQIGS